MAREAWGWGERQAWEEASEEEFSRLVLWRLSWEAPSTNRCLLASGEGTHIDRGITYGSSTVPGTLQIHSISPYGNLHCGGHYSPL